MNEPNNIPPNEIRKLMLDMAFKNSPLAAKYKASQSPNTAEGQAIKRLEVLTTQIWNQVVPIIKLDAAQNGDWKRPAAYYMCENLWRDSLAYESKTELHFLLCMLLSCMMLERLEEVDTSIPEKGKD